MTWCIDSEGIYEDRWSVKDSRHFIIHSGLCLPRSRPAFTLGVTLSSLLRDYFVGIVMPQGLCTYDLPLPVMLFSELAAPSCSSGFCPNTPPSQRSFLTNLLEMYSCHVFFFFKDHIPAWHIYSGLSVKLAHRLWPGIETHKYLLNEQTQIAISLFLTAYYYCATKRWLRCKDVCKFLHFKPKYQITSFCFPLF